MMNIYFAGSVTGGRNDAALYQKIIAHLKQYGVVLTDFLGDSSVNPKTGTGPIDETVKLLTELLKKTDVMVAEVTTPSLGIGYEIRDVLSSGKPILCLYRPQPDRRLSALIAGSRGIIVKQYQSIYEAQLYIDAFLNELQDSGKI